MKVILHKNSIINFLIAILRLNPKNYYHIPPFFSSLVISEKSNLINLYPLVIKWTLTHIMQLSIPTSLTHLDTPDSLDPTALFESHKPFDPSDQRKVFLAKSSHISINLEIFPYFI